MEAMLGDIVAAIEEKETSIKYVKCSMCGEDVRGGANWKRHFQKSCSGKDRVIKRLNKIGGLS